MPGVLEGVTAKLLASLGVDGDLAPVLAKITSVEELEALTRFMPEGQADALHMLAAGYSPEEAYAELVANEPVEEAVDPEDLAAAAGRPASQSVFYVVQRDEELVEMLNRPFELWRTFLHPAQRRYAYGDFNGPARVTGGAGTGKTVIAMHRARWLADHLVDETSGDPTARVLFTTYTTSLAEELLATMQSFCRPDALRRIDVLNVDRLAFRIVSDARQEIPRSSATTRCWSCGSRSSTSSDCLSQRSSSNRNGSRLCSHRVCVHKRSTSLRRAPAEECG